MTVSNARLVCEFQTMSRFCGIRPEAASLSPGIRRPNHRSAAVVTRCIPRYFAQWRCGGGVYHTRSPLSSRTRWIPPGAGVDNPRRKNRPAADRPQRPRTPPIRFQRRIGIATGLRPVCRDRVHSPTPGLLRNDKRSRRRQSCDDRRRGEVIIGTDAFGAIGIWRRGFASASEDPDIIGRDLACPLHLSRLEIKSEDGIARQGRRIAITITGGDIDRAAFGVDCGGAPDSGACRTPELGPGRAFAARLWRLGNRVRLPDDVTCIRIQCRHAAAERAALVLRPCCRVFFGHARDGSIKRPSCSIELRSTARRQLVLFESRFACPSSHHRVCVGVASASRRHSRSPSAPCTAQQRLPSALRCALNVQSVHPVFASSNTRCRALLPKNIRHPAMAG